MNCTPVTYRPDLIDNEFSSGLSLPDFSTSLLLSEDLLPNSLHLELQGKLLGEPKLSYPCVLGTFFHCCVQIPDEKNLTGGRNSLGSQFEWTQFIMAEHAWEQALWWQELAQWASSPHLSSLEQVAEGGQETSLGYKPAGLSLRQVPFPRVTTGSPGSANQWDHAYGKEFVCSNPNTLLIL